MAKITLKSQGKHTAKEGKGASWIISFYVIMLGLLGGTSGKEPTCLPMPETWRNKRLGFSPWVRKIPWRKAQPPTPLFLPGGSRGPSSLENYSSWGRKESDITDATEHIPTACMFL